ncbi:MAG: hypothetical protein WDZ85_01305 [Candidatus Paceibacterota bacterium]
MTTPESGPQNSGEKEGGSIKGGPEREGLKPMSGFIEEADKDKVIELGDETDRHQRGEEAREPISSPVDEEEPTPPVAGDQAEKSPESANEPPAPSADAVRIPEKEPESSPDSIQVPEKEPELTEKEVKRDLEKELSKGSPDLDEDSSESAEPFAEVPKGEPEPKKEDEPAEKESAVVGDGKVEKPAETGDEGSDIPASIIKPKRIYWLRTESNSPINANSASEIETESNQEAGLTGEEKKYWETVKEKVKQSKAFVFGQKISDVLPSVGVGMVAGAGVRSLLSIAFPGMTLIAGATAGAGAAGAKLTYEKWAKSVYRQQNKYLKELEKSFELKEGDSEFWAKAGEHVNKLADELNRKQEEIKNITAILATEENKEEKEAKISSRANLEREKESLGDRLRYLYAGMLKENKKLSATDRTKAFIDSFYKERTEAELSADKSLAGAESEVIERARLLLQFDKEYSTDPISNIARFYRDQLEGRESERLVELRKRIAPAILRGAAFGAVAGVAGGFLVDQFSGLVGGDNIHTPSYDPALEAMVPGAEVPVETGGVAESPEVSKLVGEDNIHTPSYDPALEAMVPGAEVPVETGGAAESSAVPESTGEKDIHTPSYDPALEAMVPGAEVPVEVGETMADPLAGWPDKVSLEAGSNPWNMVKDQLTEVLGREPTNAETLSVTKAVVGASDIKVAEWGISGAIDQHFLPVGYELNFGDESVTEAMKNLLSGNAGANVIAESAGSVDGSAGMPEGTPVETGGVAESPTTETPTQSEIEPSPVAEEDGASDEATPSGDGSESALAGESPQTGMEDISPEKLASMKEFFQTKVFVGEFTGLKDLDITDPVIREHLHNIPMNAVLDGDKLALRDLSENIREPLFNYFQAGLSVDMDSGADQTLLEKLKPGNVSLWEYFKSAYEKSLKQ